MAGQFAEVHGCLPEALGARDRGLGNDGQETLFISDGILPDGVDGLFRQLLREEPEGQ